MKMVRFLYLGFFLLPRFTFAQTTGPGQFSCSQDQRAALKDEVLKFVALISPEASQKWKTRPVLEFDGFNEAKYGFTRVEFYRWHVPVAGREGYDQGNMSSSTDRLAMAVHLLGPRGERWFELADIEQEEDESLFIQRWGLHESEAVSPQPSPQDAATPKSDEMDAWLHLQFATPDSKLPLFLLVYQHDSSGTYQAETIDHYLLLDLRTGSPQINREVTCTVFEPIGGACSAQDEGSETHTGIQCQWDATAGDFHCFMSIPYGSPHSNRMAQRDFYLLSNKPAKTSLAEKALADLGQLALRIRENPSAETEDVFVSELGPVTLLRRFKDLLPGSEVFVFASPGPGEMWNARLSLVTLRGNDKPAIQAIPKWGIAGDSTDEYKTESFEHVVPLTADKLGGLGIPILTTFDTYRVHLMEHRPGFSALDVILNTQMQANSVHVVYWVGLEAVNGNLVANAVRVAGDSYVYGGCGQEFHEATASLIKRKPGFAEATVRVQGQFEPEYTNPYPTAGPNCVWNGVLHWKSGAGFRVRKLGEDCNAAHQEIKITENGQISAQPEKPSP